MLRTLANGVHWIGNSHQFSPTEAIHVSAYLLQTDEGAVLVDSGSHYHEDEIMDAIKTQLDGQPLSAIIVSHADLPHAGNVTQIREMWSEVDVICATAAPELVGVLNPVNCNPGEELNISDTTFSFIDAPLADITDTVWVYEHQTKTLFTADGFGNHHAPTEAGLTYDEVDGGVTNEQIYEYHRNMFRWLEYVDPDLLTDAVESLFEGFNVRCIAPTHGHPVIGEDVDEYISRFIDILVEIIESYPTQDYETETRQ